LGFDTVAGELYVRPATNAIGNSFNSTSGNFTVNSGTIGAQTAAATTGEFLWTNPFSLAPSLQPGTRIYVVQDGAKLGGAAWPAGIGLNKNGQNDFLLLVKVSDVLRDEGFATFFARRGGTVYSHFEGDLSGGGRVPIPLSPQANALNDGFGHYNVTWTGGGGAALLAGDIVAMNSDSEIAAIVANVTDSGGTGDFDYFLIRSLNQLTAAAASAESPATKTMTLGTPTSLQPVTDATTISPIVHGAISKDILNGNGTRLYSIEVDPNSLSFVRVYRALQFMLRRGSTEQLDGMDGEQYTGSTLHINYSGQAGGEFSEGAVVYDSVTSAFGTVVADHASGTDGDIILRNTRGSFAETSVLWDAISSPTVTADIDTVRTVPTLSSAVLGNIAGGTYFGAPGMFFTLANIASGEEKLYQLVDDLGVTQTPPNTVPVAVTSMGTGDWVSVFRLDAALTSGGQIVKNEYTGHATNNNAGGTTYEVTTTISSEAPPDGVVSVVVSTDVEEQYWYASYATTVFTLVNITDVAESAGDTTGLTCTRATGDWTADGVLPGMIIQNTTDGSRGIVKTVGTTTLTLETQNNGQGLTGGAENDWDISDNIRINKLVADRDSLDTYVPFLHAKNTAGTDETTTVIQSSPINVVVRVRQGKVILPFTVGQTIGSAGMSQAAIRNLDTIAT